MCIRSRESYYVYGIACDMTLHVRNAGSAARRWWRDFSYLSELRSGPLILLERGFSAKLQRWEAREKRHSVARHLLLSGVCNRAAATPDPRRARDARAQKGISGGRAECTYLG